MVSNDESTRGATIWDVARHAGVSHQTVSRVVNDLPNVSIPTRLKVEASIEALRFRPNAVARSLASKRSRTIGIITTGSFDYGPSSTLLGFIEAAREASYLLSITSMREADDASVRASVDMLLEQEVEGIAVIAAQLSALETIRSINVPVPLVVVESSGTSGLHSVSADQRQGAYLATKFLIDAGHTRIAHISGPADNLDAIQRERGWRDALMEAGLSSDGLLPGDWSPGSGYALGRQLALDRRWTAVFVANDEMALGALHALSDRGLRVPDDVSVVGFDDIPGAEHAIPPLTTVRPDFTQLGRSVLHSVLGLVHGDTGDDELRAVPELIVRASVTSVRGAP